MKIHPHEHDNIEEIEHILMKLPTFKESSRASFIFSSLSDPSRLRILWLICHSEQCVSNIASCVEMSSPAVSHHLRFLKQLQIVTSYKQGKETIYKLNDNEYAKLAHQMIDDIFNLECPNKNI